MEEKTAGWTPEMLDNPEIRSAGREVWRVELLKRRKIRKFVGGRSFLLENEVKRFAEEVFQHPKKYFARKCGKSLVDGFFRQKMRGIFGGRSFLSAGVFPHGKMKPKG
jgi:hypothetical protein